MRKIILITCCLFSLYGCNSIDVDYSKYLSKEKSLELAVQEAKTENKYLWVALGNEQNCGYTKELLKALALSGTFTKYSDRFVFYVADIESVDRYYRYILLPPALPNSYVFNQEGKVISLYEKGGNKTKFIEEQLESVLKNKPRGAILHENYSVGGGRLLNHVNMLIDVTKSVMNESDSLKLIESKKLLDSVSDLDKNFYYYYLQAEIALKLNDSIALDSCSTKAIDIFNSGINIIYLDDLYKEMKKYSKKYLAGSKELPVLSFEATEIECGDIKLDHQKRFELSFENTGNSPLVILSTSTSCDCVKTEYPKKPVLKGEKGNVSFDFDARVKGFFSKDIFFKSNASNTIQKVTLKGTVK